MLEWIKNINKEYPEFWKEYVSKFDYKSSRYVVFSIESTGLNPDQDVILSFAGISVIDNKIVINDSFEAVLLQYKYLHDNGLSNDFIKESTQPKLGEYEALQKFVEYIGNAVLVGHRIHYAVDLINSVLEKMDCNRLKNEALDIEIMHAKLNDITEKPFSLEDLSTIYKVPQTDMHTSSEDAYTVALLFLKLKARLGLPF